LTAALSKTQGLNRDELGNKSIMKGKAWTFTLSAPGIIRIDVYVDYKEYIIIYCVLQFYHTTQLKRHA
jgi:hypothetical protein